MKRDRVNGEMITSKKIKVILDWSVFHKQYSGGLIGNLLSREESIVDCDGAIIVEQGTGNHKQYSLVNLETPTAFNAAIVYGGDNIHRNVNNEFFTIDMDRIPADIQRLVFTLDIFKNTSVPNVFGKLELISIRVLNDETGKELCRYDSGITSSSKVRAFSVGALNRTENGWLFTPEESGFKAMSYEMLLDEFVQR